jgi:hypothetical protein
MSNTDLIVTIRGKVPGGTKNDIINTFRDCYRKFGARSPYKVEVLITETEGIKRDSLREEHSKLGRTAIENEDEVCTHHTWSGYITVNVSIERLEEFSKLARQGALRHEAAHTVLHGSLEHNIFRIPEDCRQMATIKGLNPAVLEQIVPTLSTAIKEYEVSKFLIAHDFIDCQAAFMLEWIQPPQQDKAGLKFAKMDRQTKFMYLTGLLRPILLADPLLAIPKSKKISLERQVFLGRRIEELIEHIADYERNKLLQVANSISDIISQNTHDNVDSALHQAMTLA